MNTYLVIMGIAAILSGISNLISSILNIQLGLQWAESIVVPVILAIMSVLLICAGIYLIYMGVLL